MRRSDEKGGSSAKRARQESFGNRPFEAFGEALKKQRRLEQQAAEAARRQAQRVTPPQPQPPAPMTDEDLLQREMHGVRPISASDALPPLRPVATRPPRDDEAEAMAELADLVAGRGLFDFTASDEYIEGIAQGLNRRLLKRLRHGQFAVQAHLDLHGKTRVEAHQEVERFVVSSLQRGLRCVLIVHGRGLNSKDQIPVLKESLKVWLARGRIARSVLAFCTARPSDGGAGAVYVLLRR